MTTNRIIFLVSTVLMSALFLFSAGMYLFQNEMIQGAFTSLGFPIWIIYPLAIVKILGVAALWIPAVPAWIREWAYAGFFYDALLAMGAHLAVGDGGHWTAVVALVLTFVSRHYLYRQGTTS